MFSSSISPEYNFDQNKQKDNGMSDIGSLFSQHGDEQIDAFNANILSVQSSLPNNQLLKSKISSVTPIRIVSIRQYTKNNFIDQKDMDDYNCCICLDTIYIPFGNSNCDHLFCKKCIQTWGNNNELCPICRKKLILFPNKWVENKLMNMDIKCTLTDDKTICDCKLKMGTDMHNLYTHQDTVCKYGLVKCDCSPETFYRKDINSHSEKCKYAMVECEYCKCSIYRKDLNTHQNNSDFKCQSFIKCQNGCGVVLSTVGDDYVIHIRKCPYKVCIHCTVFVKKSDINEHIESLECYKKRFQIITDENIKLKEMLKNNDASKLIECPKSNISKCANPKHRNCHSKYSCCHCQDKRPHLAVFYNRYIDGRGYILGIGKRSDAYCPSCK
jgi:hypothetical protein